MQYIFKYMYTCMAMHTLQQRYQEISHEIKEHHPFKPWGDAMVTFRDENIPDDST